MSFNPRDIYYIFDEPVPYKNLLIYPAMMRQYLTFHTYASCLLLEKNSVPDVKVISMSYYNYMLSISTMEDNYIGMFRELLKLVLKQPALDFNAGYTEADNKPVFILDGVIYDSVDFDNLREIISEQNILELPNELIQKDVRDKMEETRRIRDKMNNRKMASLEDQIIAVAIYSGWDLEKIYNLTIRKFIKTLQRADHILHSKIYLEASMSGMVTFDEPPKHWLAEIVTTDTTTVDLEAVQNKINFNDAKK